MKGFLEHYEGDISDVDFNNCILPHLEIFDRYMFDVIIPDITAYFIATGYNNCYVFHDSLEVFVSDMLARVNYDSKDVNVHEIKEKVKKVLESKHGLITINEDPLEFR